MPELEETEDQLSLQSLLSLNPGFIDQSAASFIERNHGRQA